LQGPLLTALTALVTNSRAQPNHILCFPATAEVYDPVPNNRTSGSNSPIADSPTRDNNAAGTMAWTIRQQHIRTGKVHIFCVLHPYLWISYLNTCFINVPEEQSFCS